MALFLLQTLLREVKKVNFQESYMSLTDYGKSFCSICLTTTKVVTVKGNP